ncbi:MAG: DUF4827 domain-containing protein [Mediterranea sp.]|jgi:hypothetical protein|nr:DUF4827 domain-containing protein [Mediterranea sp.]
MRKIISLLLLSLTCGLAFQACSDSKTYAEMLEEEKRAINKFIKDNNIKVITASEFGENGNKTNVDKNEYVQLSNGVYMQIVDYGKPDADSIRSRDIITVRFMEYDILEGDTTAASNYYIADYLDVFDYTASKNVEPYGQFRTTENGVEILSRLVAVYGTTQVPQGWLAPLPFVKTYAHVKLIVPSKTGHSTAMQYVYPFYYDLRRITVW